MAAVAKRCDLAFFSRFVLHLPRILGAFIALAFYLATARADHTCRFHFSRFLPASLRAVVVVHT